MRFGETLKTLRKSRNLTQKELAKEIGITDRGLQNYELGNRFPKRDILTKIAVFFAVPLSSLLCEEDKFVLEAGEKGNPKDVRNIDKMVGEIGAMFAGGEVSEADMDKAMQAMNAMYWRAKEKAQKKFTPKKYRRQPAE